MEELQSILEVYRSFFLLVMDSPLFYVFVVVFALSGLLRVLRSALNIEQCMPVSLPEDVRIMDGEPDISTEAEPETMHQDSKRIKMVRCKHCLAEKPKGGTCWCCGLG